jgi:predicted transcriptional regulator
MTSEELPPLGARQAEAPEGSGDREERAQVKHGTDPLEDRRLNLTDPKAIRALAHPVRWALLEALSQAGTLTATQASEMLGDSPANCAFHLRTLAKYGFVEEAGGGRGRERPWRQSYDSMSWRTRQDDPQASQAAEALDQVWLDRSLARARRSLTSISSWPRDLLETLGGTTRRLYLTPEEAGELYTELRKTLERLDRYRERRDPNRRPTDALPIEFILLGYPVLDLPPLPGAAAGADDDSDDGMAADGLALPD